MDIALFLLRFSMGILFVAHGSQKVFGAFGGGGISNFSAMLSGLGFNPPLFWAYLAGYVELLGGLFLLAGFLTRTSAALLFILIIVATLKVHLTKGFFLSNGGFEYNFVITCVLLAILIAGPGKFSLIKKF